MGKKVQEANVITQNQSNGTRWLLESVLPQGEAEGFFLMRIEGEHGSVGPTRVKEITALLSNGSTFRMTVLRDEEK